MAECGCIIGADPPRLKGGEEHLVIIYCRKHAEVDNLLAALARLREAIETFCEHADACIFCGDASGDTHAADCPNEQADNALAAARGGAS